MPALRPERAGNILVTMALATTMAMGVGAMVVDGAVALAAKTRLQAAVDAGALAAAFDLAPVPDQAKALVDAQAWIKQNGVVPATTSVTIKQVTDGAWAVTVSANQSEPALFAKFFGIQNLPVSATSSARLMSPKTIAPGYLLPFALPAFKNASGKWYVLTASTGTFELATVDPALGGPTRVVLKDIGGNGTSGNFQELAIDGTGASDYKASIINGVQTPVTVGDQLLTKPGGSSGPTLSALAERLAKGPSFADIVVPLIKKEEWADITGRREVTVIGFAAMHLDATLKGSSVDATYKYITLAGQSAGAGNNLGPDVGTPTLIPTP